MGKTATAGKQGLSTTDLLKSMAQSTEATSKSKVGEYPVDEETHKLATRLWHIKQQQTELKTEFDAGKVELLNKVLPIRDDFVISSGYHESGKVGTTDGHWCTLTWSDKYEKLDTTMESTLRDICGKRYDELFETKTAISVRDDIDDADLTYIIEKVTMEKFAKCFKVTQVLKPTTKYTKERHILFSKTVLDTLNSLVKQIFSFRTK